MEAERFKKLLKRQIYRGVFNWIGLEKVVGLEPGRIKEVVYGEKSFSEEETALLFTFFSHLANDSLDIPLNYTA